MKYAECFDVMHKIHIGIFKYNFKISSKSIHWLPDQNSKAILNDIGTEELAHLEMVGTIVHQLTKGTSIEEIEKAGLGQYYTDHGLGVYPQAASGFTFSESVLAVKGDPIADRQEDLVAEQKARSTYEIIIRYNLLGVTLYCKV